LRLTLIAVVLLVLLVAFMGLVWTQQRRLIYFPSGTTPDPGTVGLDGITPVSFQTTDGLTLNGWFVTRTNTPEFTVIVFNGNAGNRAYRAGLAQAFARGNMATLLFDYRGFGGNPGSPSESGLNIDARAAREYVISRTGVNRDRLVYFGESLGTAVATELAIDHPPAALILRSPFTSLADMGRQHYPMLPVRWLLRDRYDTIGRIARIRAPLLIIAGDRDRIVPIEQTRRLYDAAGQPKSLLVIPGADHNDESLVHGREMMDAVLRFLHNLPGM
jgi:fermentation-respiration switch protein FrsA (DUF1100 family)